MIQRIQTVFLAIVVILMAALTPLPYLQIQDVEKGEKITLYALEKVSISPESDLVVEFMPYVFVSILALLSCGIAIYQIFQFKKRLLQIKLGALNALFMGGALVLMTYFVDKNGAGVQQVLLPYYFPIIALVCNILSNRFIRRDEKLVRSADRMR